MDLREIDTPPSFTSDIDEHTLRQLPKNEQYLAVAFSKLRQEVRWATERAIEGRNLAIQTAQQIKSERTWLIGTILAAIIAEIIRVGFSK